MNVPFEARKFRITDDCKFLTASPYDLFGEEIMDKAKSEVVEALELLRVGEVYSYTVPGSPTTNHFRRVL